MKNPKRENPSLFPSPRLSRRTEGLVFSPLAWLKLLFFLHAGDTEVGGFGVSSEDDLLYVEDFQTVKQRVSAVTVEFDDAAVADYVDRCVDQGIVPQRCMRCWIHTHPGESPDPSSTDEHTFARVFGSCDWSIIFIIGRTEKTYARLSFAAGPGASMLLPVSVDWAAWPQLVCDHADQILTLMEEWQNEYGLNIFPEEIFAMPPVSSDSSPLDHRGVDLTWQEYQDYYGLGEENFLLEEVMA